MTSKHIALIHTGGTIGMAKTAQGYAPMKDFTALLSTLLAGMRNLPRCTFIEYATPIDSANAAPGDWQRIARDIADRYRDFDGFVVLHGTDTMAYTAAALSFMLQGLRKPVIMTGAQIPLAEPNSDGLQNLVTALQFAASDDIAEVAICFGQRLLRGNRATKISVSRLQAFDSPNYSWLGEAGRGIKRSALLPRGEGERFELPAYVSGQVLSLRFAPGLPASAVQAMLDLNPRALILQAYGAGNAPQDPALTTMLSRAAERGVVLVTCSQCLHGAVALDAYATGSALARAGVIGAKDMTFEAVFAKLHHLLALGLSADRVRVEMLRNLSGELTA